MRVLFLSVWLTLFCLVVEQLSTCSGAATADLEDVVREAWIAQLKRTMLDQLGWDEVPSGLHTLTETPAEVLEEYRILTTLQSTQARHLPIPGAPAIFGLKSFRGNISKIQSSCSKGGILRESYTAAFTFQWPKGKEMDNKIELFLYQVPASPIEGSTSETHATVQISDTMLVNKTSFASIPLCTKTVSMATKQAHTVFDITGNNGAWLASHISDSGTAEVQLAITVYRKCTNGTLAASYEDSATNSSDSTTAPRLVVTLKNSNIGDIKTRKKRMEELSMEQQQAEYYCAPNSSDCCLHNLTIDFHQDLHFDFIKTPRTFVFHYCAGVCEPWSNQHLQTPEVYTILAGFHGSNRQKLLPCCAPGVSDRLSVITTLEDRPLINFENVVVRTCQCY